MYTNTYGDLHVDWVTAPPPPLILIEEVALNKKDFATTNEE